MHHSFRISGRPEFKPVRKALLGGARRVPCLWPLASAIGLHCPVYVDRVYTVVMDWSADDVRIVTAVVTTPAGRLRDMATVWRCGRRYEFDGLHIHGEDVTANGFESRGLLRALRALLEIIDADEIIVRGAVRTTGANPGHRPRDIRIARKIQPQA